VRSPALRWALNTYISWALLVAFVFFHRYPSLGLQIRSGRWFDGVADAFE
jgi:hypothetical protein